jgi:hypothetical protein
MFTQKTLVLSRVALKNLNPTSVHMITSAFPRMTLGLTPAFVIPMTLGGISVLAGVNQGFHTSVFSLAVNSDITSSRSPIEGLVYNLGDPIPQAIRFYYELPSIHSSNFFEQLMKVVNALISSVPDARFNLMIEAILPNGNRRTVGKSFIISQGTTSQVLETFLTPFIESFETQSGSGELEGFSDSSLVRVHNITTAPNPEAHPFSSDPANIQWVKETKATQKATKRSASSAAIKDL